MSRATTTLLIEELACHVSPEERPVLEALLRACSEQGARTIYYVQPHEDYDSHLVRPLAALLAHVPPTRIQVVMVGLSPLAFVESVAEQLRVIAGGSVALEECVFPNGMVCDSHVGGTLSFVLPTTTSCRRTFRVSM